MNSVKVAVRCRPLSSKEKEGGAEQVVFVERKSNTVTLKPSPFVSSNPSITPGRTPKKGRNHSRQYQFDFCYGKDSTQEQVFHDIGTTVLENAFAGYNASVFAYGQTGSGKTHTMVGTKSNNESGEGLIPRISRGLVEHVSKIKEATECPNTNTNSSESEVNRKPVTMVKLEASYLEIYNENCCDLLKPGSKKERESLKVREHPKTGAYVEGLTSVCINSLEDVERIMNVGAKSRTVACTNMNSRSSRSHAIFTLVFTQTKISADMSAAIDTVSKINLVDLAGSERVAASGVAGQRLKETANINKSLHMLGRVISALAKLNHQEKPSVEGRNDSKENSPPNTPQKTPNTPQKLRRRKQDIIPYRDSTLTWLLKPSLGGNSKTTMFVAVSPACYNFDETLTTLRYANDCSRIVNNAIVNRGSNTEVVAQLRLEIDLLRERLEASTKASVATDGRTIGDLLSELENLKKVESESEKEKKHFVNKYNETLSLTKSFEEKIVILEKDRQVLTQEKKQSLQHLESLKSSNMELTETISKLRRNISKLEENIAVNEKDIIVLKEDRDSQIADFESLINMKDAQMKKIKQESHAQLEQCTEKYNNEIKKVTIELKTEMANSKRQMKDSQQKLLHLENEKNEQLSSQKLKYESEISKLVSSLNEAIAETKALEKSNEELASEIWTTKTQKNDIERMEKEKSEELNNLKESIVKLNSELNQKTGDLEKLGDSQAKLVLDIERLKAELDQVEKVKNLKQGRIHKLEKCIENIKEDVVHQKNINQVSGLDSMRSKLEAELLESRADSKRLKEKIEMLKKDHETRAQNLKDECNSVQKLFEQNKTALEKTNASLNGLESQIKDYEIKIENLNRKMSESETTIMGKDKELERLNEMYASICTEKDKSEKEYKKSKEISDRVIQSLKETSAELQQKVKECEGTIEKLRDQIEEKRKLDEKCDEASKDLKGLVTMAAKRRKSIQTLIVKRRDLKKQNEDLSSLVEEKEKIISEKETVLQKKEDTIRDLSENVDDLKLELSQLEETKQGLIQEGKDKESIIRKKEEENSVLETKISDMQVVHKELLCAREEQNEELKLKESEIKSLQMDNNNFDSKIAKLEDKLRLKCEKNEGMKASLEKVKVSFDALLSTNTELAEKAKKLQSEAEKRDEAIGSLASGLELSLSWLTS